MRAIDRIILIALALAQGATAQSAAAQKEIALGRSMMEQIGGVTTSDPVVADFVKALVAQIAGTSSSLSGIQMRLLDSPEASTASLPGGFLLVRSGVITRMETAGEFAAVLAHSMAHIAAGHGPVKELANAGGSSIVYMGGWNGVCARMPGSALPAGFLARAAASEEQADLMALEYLDRAGFDPSSLVAAFDRIRSTDAPAGFTITSAVREKAQSYAGTGSEYVTNTSAFNDVHERLEKRVALR